MKHLIEAGRVTEAGMAAYRARDPGHSERAAYEQGEVNLPAEYERRLRAVPEAWSYWEEETTVVPEAGDLVGGEREARGDAPPATEDPDRIVCNWRRNSGDAEDGAAEEVTGPLFRSDT